MLFERMADLTGKSPGKADATQSGDLNGESSGKAPGQVAARLKNNFPLPWSGDFKQVMPAFF